MQHPAMEDQVRGNLETLSRRLLLDGDIAPNVAERIPLAEHGRFRSAARRTAVVVSKMQLDEGDVQDATAAAETLADLLELAATASGTASPIDLEARSATYTGTKHGAWSKGARLGKGGQGQVWIVWNNSLCEAGALKLSTAKPDDAKAAERFEREAKALHEVRHPCILRLLDEGDDPEPFFVTQRAPFGSLNDNLAAFKGDAWRVLRLARDVARGLEAAHDRSLIHRDLKPGNIFLFHLDHAAIGDFGIVHDPGLETLTSVDERVGPRMYAPPEWVGNRDPKPTFDVYCLGGVIHTALLGQHPSREYRSMKTIAELANELDDERLEPIDELVAEMLQDDESKRPESMDTVVRLLDDIFQQMFGARRHRPDACAHCGAKDFAFMGRFETTTGTQLLLEGQHARTLILGGDFKPSVHKCQSCGRLRFEDEIGLPR